MNSLHGGILLLPYILGFGIPGIALAKLFSKSKPTDRIYLVKDENGVWKERQPINVFGEDSIKIFKEEINK